MTEDGAGSSTSASGGTDGGTGEPTPETREALVTIAHGSVVTAGGFSVQRVLVLATEFVLARALGPVVYGVYALGWRVGQLVGRFAPFGAVPTLQRYVPADADAPARRGAMVGLAYATTLAVGSLLGAGLFLAAGWIDAHTLEHPLLPPTLRMFAVLVVVTGLVRVHAAVLRAVGSANGSVLFNQVLYPGARLAAVGVALALGYTVVGVVGAIALAVGLLALLGLRAVVGVSGIRPSVRGWRAELRRYLNHAVPVTASGLGKVFQNRLDILLVGVLLSASATGVYGAVLVLVAVAWLPLISFNKLMPHVASDLYDRGAVPTLNAVYTAVTRLVVTAVVPLVAVQLVYGRALLGLFGPAYVAGYAPLAIYLGGVFVGSAVGATGWHLLLTDHQYARMVLDWLLAVSNLVLSYLFVVRFGLAGAALGTSLSLAVQNGVQALLLRRFEGLWPFDRTFALPVVAGGCMALAMATVRAVLGGAVPGGAGGTVLGGPVGIALGIVVGGAVYLGVLRGLGVPAADRLVVRELTARYRGDLGTLLGRLDAYRG
ncbi:MAG: oligosaccharide flippase family protein [Halobacteriaceae archaeon]